MTVVPGQIVAGVLIVLRLGLKIFGQETNVRKRLVQKKRVHQEVF